jgi:formylglycine-generating enzyme required for sulfatase activity
LSNKQKRPFVRIFSDLPVTNSVDLAFEFEWLATTLAELAWNPDNQTPFTVVVRGGWGRGKTTLLRQTQRLLDEPQQADGAREVRTVWFNAWKYPDEDTVLAGLLGALLDEFRQGNMLDQLKFHIDNHKTQLARTVLHAAAPWAFGKPSEQQAWQGRYSTIDEKRAFNDLFRDLFVQASYMLFHGSAAIRDTGSIKPQALWDEQTQRKYTLAIFLDDLDRCKQKRVLEVLEAINLFLDLPGVSFFMGLDSERLLDLLPDHLQGHKEEFLEKVVQISLDLPEISEPGASEYLQKVIKDTSLGEVLKGEGFNDIQAVASILGSRHPRHIKRFLNDLSMTLAMLRNSERLGDQPTHLSERVVVAWHLLREGLPAEKWREIRALSSNLEAFLRQWKAAATAENRQEIQKGWGVGLRKLHQAGNLHAHVEILLGLSTQQRDLLVHAGSPPREVVSKEKPRKSLSGSVSAGIDWVEISAGSFQMGSEQKDEAPVHDVTLPGFRIATVPVTNAQYAEYVAAINAQSPDHWTDGQIPEGKENHPVVNVSWREAVDFCRWLTEKMGEQGKNLQVQLPSEPEWEYVARGTEGREYPWGPEAPDAERCNFDSNIGDTTPVGAYPKGATLEGVQDLSGNVWEWTRSKWEKYPYPADENKRRQREALSGSDRRMLRGGSFYYGPRDVRCACRGSHDPDLRNGGIGFRVVVSPLPSLNDAASGL